MIPEDAIWILELIRNRDARTEAEKDAVNAAIEALKAQLSQQGTTFDLISRQAAIDALDDQITQCDKALGSFDISMKDEYAVKVERASLKAYRETLNVLPSAQPEPTYEQVEEYCKKRCLHVVTADFFESTKPQRLGRWIKHIDPFGGEQYECSECGVLWEFTDGTPEDNEAYFCPKCGAKMKGEPNE